MGFKNVLQLSYTATLVQAGRTFDNLLTSLDFGPDAASQTVTIATDGQWTAEASDSWLTVTPVSGTGETVVSIAVTDNMSSEPRPGSVIVTVGSITRIIAVTQAGRYFTVDPTSFAELPSKGGTHAVHIATNEAWTATSTSNWIQLSARSGKGDVDVTLTVPDNPSIHARKDTTAFAPIYHQPVRVVTSQAARYLRVDVSALSFFAKGGVSQPVTVTTDASYTVTTSVSWLTVQQTGDVFTVTAAGNTDESERTGEVIISMIGLMGHEHYALKIPVSQCALSAGVDVQPFGEEQQWDVYAGSQATIRVTGFAAERSWDDAASGRATVSVTTFGEDQRWD